jgi:energy-coupling factor transporter ATP-binding protein EcfA2
MPRHRIVFVVGHSNWGKSSLLRAMTGRNFHQKKESIANVEFFIRRMSNDDKPKGYVEFMRSLKLQRRPNVIAAFCPKFGSKEDTTPAILQPLKQKGYELFFWVMQYQQGPGGSEITNTEIEVMRRFGHVEVFHGKTTPQSLARKFSAFVAAVVESPN